MADNYVTLPGVSANHFSTPDAAVLDLAANVWVAARVALDDWTPGSVVAIVAKSNNTGDQRTFLFSVDGSGVLGFRSSSDGTAGTEVTSNSSAAPTVVDRAILWIGAFFDNTADTVTFYTGGAAATPVWVQLGTVPAHVQGALFDSTALATIGATDDPANPLNGKVYRAQLGTVDGGASGLVFDVDFTDATKFDAGVTAFTEPENSLVFTGNGDQWVYVRAALNTAAYQSPDGLWLAGDGNGAYGPSSINPWADLSGNDHHAQLGAAVGAGADDPTFASSPARWVYDGADFHEIADDDFFDLAETDPLTVLVVALLDDRNPSDTNKLVSKKTSSTGAAVGWAVFVAKISGVTGNGGLGGHASDGTDQPTAEAVLMADAGQPFSAAWVRDVSADQIRSYENGVLRDTIADATTATLVNTEALRFGANTQPSEFLDGAILSVSIYKRVLGDGEILTALAALGGAPLGRATSTGLRAARAGVI